MKETISLKDNPKKLEGVLTLLHKMILQEIRRTTELALVVFFITIPLGLVSVLSSALSLYLFFK